MELNTGSNNGSMKPSLKIEVVIPHHAIVDVMRIEKVINGGSANEIAQIRKVKNTEIIQPFNGFIVSRASAFKRLLTAVA